MGFLDDFPESFGHLVDEYLPSRGEGDNKATQVVTAVNKLIFKFWNDGDVFDNTHGLEGWANDISSYANWLYKYLPECRGVLNGIYQCRTEEDYEDLLEDLAVTTLDENLLEDLALEDRQGSVYDCSGPFKFRDMNDDDSEYDEEETFDEETAGDPEW